MRALPAMIVMLAFVFACGHPSSSPPAPSQLPPPTSTAPAPSAPAMVEGTDGAPEASTSGEPAPSDEPPEEAMELTKGGVGIVVLQEGSGRPASVGDELVVHYVGKLEDGSVFDSSRERGQPFALELGAEMVIPGWEEGLAGMRQGEVRRLIVPPSMGYGSRGLGEVPPEAMLEFEIELLRLEPAPP